MEDVCLDLDLVLRNKVQHILCFALVPLVNVPTILISLKMSSGNGTHTVSSCATCTILL
jgi:hypothetical protein